MRILLDTCTFLWIAGDAPELSRTARELYADPGNEVHLSVVSAWEISVKAALGRLRTPTEPSLFVPEQRTRRGIASLPLDEAAALALGRLPAVHRDPFDRMLVCQAMTGGMTIVTPDPAIRQYPVLTAW